MTNKITLLFIGILLHVIGFSQNKNLSVSFKYGITNVQNVSESGSQFSPQINYHFYKAKKANLTLTGLYNNYTLNTNDFFTLADGTSINFSQSFKRSYLGIGISSQIKLLSSEKKWIPYIQPQLLFQYEISNNDGSSSQSNGVPPTTKNILNTNITTGIIYNKRIQFGLYYEFSLTNTQFTSIPTSSYGGFISYLFQFQKKKKITEK
jgi:hypothetical protein